jgi:hypothetical protein
MEVRMRRALVATAVLALALALAALVGCRPATPMSSTASPSPSATLATPVTPIPVAVVFGDTIQLADGRRIRLGLPDSERARAATRVASGWIVATDPFGTLWLVRDGERPTFVGGGSGGYLVTTDGRRLITIGPVSRHDSATLIAALDLPSLAERTLTDLQPLLHLVPNHDTVGAVGVSGDHVVLRIMYTNVGGPTGAAVWDMRTGAVRAVPTKGVWLWSVAADQVLRRIDHPHPTTVQPVLACLDVVDLTMAFGVGETGYCGTQVTSVADGTLSPDGQWAMLQGLLDGSIPGEPILLRSADLRAGHWAPHPLAWPARTLFRMWFWDSDRSFIAGGSGDYPFYRCVIDGPCQPVALSPDMRTPSPEAYPVAGPTP